MSARYGKCNIFSCDIVCITFSLFTCSVILQSCTKVALDFVSPENFEECIKYTNKIRELPNNHMVNEDKLEVCRQFRLSYMLILINDFIIVLFLVAPDFSSS